MCRVSSPERRTRSVPAYLHLHEEIDLVRAVPSPKQMFVHVDRCTQWLAVRWCVEGRLLRYRGVLAAPRQILPFSYVHCQQINIESKRANSQLT
jgi:hypothetical protein